MTIRVLWPALAFVSGLISRGLGFPPLVGFLAAGFILNARGYASHKVWISIFVMLLSGL
jgi:predicted Kef-type K+ transport protein